MLIFTLIHFLLPVTFGNPLIYFSTSGMIPIFMYVFIPGNYQYDCSVGAHAVNGMVGQLIVNAYCHPQMVLLLQIQIVQVRMVVLMCSLVQSVPPSSLKILYRWLNTAGSWITLATQNSNTTNTFTTNLQNLSFPLVNIKLSC